jgi:hypothetical protein
MKELGKQVEEQGIQIPWNTVSKRMGKRSRLSCFKKWQKMSGCLGASDEFKRRAESGESESPDAKRAKMEDVLGATAGQAAGDFDMYSAEMAAETVEAVELPDTGALGSRVQEIV